MSIPEVSSRSRLLSFLQGYLKKIDSVLVKGLLQVNGGADISGSVNITGSNTGTALRVSLGDPGVSPSSAYNNFVFQSSDSIGMSFLAPTAKVTRLTFGSPEDASGLSIIHNPTFSYGLVGTLSTGHTLYLTSGDAAVGITIDENQIVTKPSQPAVAAFRSSTQDLDGDNDWNTVIFNDESSTNDTVFDVGGDYNTGTGVFTAPADGKYLISAVVMLTNVPATTGYIMLKLITTKSAADALNLYAGRVNPGSWDAEMNYYQVPGTWLAAMDSGDTAYVQVRDTSADSDTKIYGSTTGVYTRIQIIKVA